MIDKLKTFVRKHKQEFDSREPSQDLWKKIDARMEMKPQSSISSKWLSKLKYLGLSASVLMITVYIISRSIGNSSSGELTQSKKDTAMHSLGQWVKANQNRTEVIAAKNSIPDPTDNPAGSENDFYNNSETPESPTVIKNITDDGRKDSVKVRPNENLNSDQNKVKPEVHLSSMPKEEIQGGNSASERKEINAAISPKKTEALTEISDKLNSYSCSIWDGSSFCAVIRNFKFPGQVSVDGNIETTSCSKLGSINNLKAVRLKGRTAKKITLSLTEDFKNIVLQKSDGSKITPVAISHYYKGLGVISGYKGKRFQIIFKNKVELILFFRDVEVGDKIMIDKTIEAVVSKP
jgi:hypothetical protein